MSRIVLIGRGPIPGPGVTQMGFSSLRTAAFASALTCPSIELRIVLLIPGCKPTAPHDWSGIATVAEEGPGWLDRVRELAEGADGIVSAGPYNPGRAAIAASGSAPTWIDIPGDPMSELAALSRVHAEPLSQERIAAAMAACSAVLARADAISVISHSQRLATLGQLGLMGRTLKAAQTPNIEVIPITGNFGFERRPPPQWGQFPTVALSGAFNPWFDDERVCESLEAAFKLNPNLRVVTTGGGIGGFYEQGFQRFQRWASNHPNRVSIHEWVPHGEVESILRRAHVGLSMDRSGPEPELGSRTRLLLFAELGLVPASTVACDLTKEWVDAGAMVGLSEDPVTAGEQLASLDASDQSCIHSARRLIPSELVNERLLKWCQNPSRTEPTEATNAVLAKELETIKSELARIYASPTWSALNKLHSASLGRFKARQG